MPTTLSLPQKTGFLAPQRDTQGTRQDNLGYRCNQQLDLPLRRPNSGSASIDGRLHLRKLLHADPAGQQL